MSNIAKLYFTNFPIGIIKDDISKTNNFELNQNHTRRSSRLEFDRQMV